MMVNRQPGLGRHPADCHRPERAAAVSQRGAARRQQPLGQ